MARDDLEDIGERLDLTLKCSWCEQVVKCIDLNHVIWWLGGVCDVGGEHSGFIIVRLIQNLTAEWKEMNDKPKESMHKK